MALASEKNVAWPLSNVSKSTVHLIAGAAAGMTTALVTAPLDILRTRLQAEMYREEQVGIVSSILRREGVRGFFKGVLPSMAGVVPATTVKFYTYGNAKNVLQEYCDLDQTSIVLHTSAAALAGVTTSTITNPIWVVKTRLQLDTLHTNRKYQNSWDCVARILRYEGIRGLYRGLSASYLGAVETTLHLASYEYIRSLLAGKAISSTQRKSRWIDATAAGGLSKIFATIMLYPHEVIRTRLRQKPLPDGSLKYTGVVQCCQLVLREEGIRALYGGMIPHLLRAIPSAAISLTVYEVVSQSLRTVT